LQHSKDTAFGKEPVAFLAKSHQNADRNSFTSDHGANGDKENG
jgi:hypothetical protein